MSYRATVTMPDAGPVTICDYATLTEARFSCQNHLSATWDKVLGSGKFLDPRHAYDRGQFSQWDGRPRLYVSMPNGDTAHYDVVELSRNAGDKGSEN